MTVTTTALKSKPVRQAERRTNMATQAAASQPAADPCLCTSMKGTLKSGFPSKAAAEMWFQQKQKENGWEPQRAYQCPTSSLWHLTSDPEPKQPAPVQVHMPKVPETPARARRGEVQEAVESLLRREPNLTPKEISKRVGFNLGSVQSVYYAWKKSVTAKPAPKTLDAIAQAKAEITRRKADSDAEFAAAQARLEAEEKAMREALLPKVIVFGNNGETQVRVTYKNQPQTYTLEAARVLSAQLCEKLPREHGTTAA